MYWSNYCANMKTEWCLNLCAYVQLNYMNVVLFRNKGNCKYTDVFTQSSDQFICTDRIIYFITMCSFCFVLVETNDTLKYGKILAKMWKCKSIHRFVQKVSDIFIISIVVLWFISRSVRRLLSTGVH